MATTRRIYAGKALWVGPTGTAGTVQQIDRVQSANASFSINRQNVDQYGQLAALSREIIDQPTVSLEFSYLVADLTNEVSIGLTVGATSAVTDILTVSDEKNYYMEYVADGSDAVGAAGTGSYIGIGNGFISNYTAQGAVGGLPSVNVSVEAMNITYNTSPTINPADGTAAAGGGSPGAMAATTGVAGQASALRPGDCTVTITPSVGTSAGVGVLISDAKIQSYNVSYALTRTPLNKLGSRFAFARPIQFPATASASISAEIGDLGGSQTSLADILCADRTYTVSVVLREPLCGATTGAVAAAWILKGANLDSQNITTSIGANDKIDLTFSTQINGPQDTARGIFLSGIAR